MSLRSRLLPLGTVLLVACSGGGGSSKPAPSITKFAAEPASISAGGRSTLSWTVSAAQSCNLNGLPVAAAAGSQDTGALSASTEYSLQCTGAGGNDTRRLIVAVTTPPPPSAVAIARFTAEPAEVAPGAASTLRWQVQHATACRLNGENVDAREGERGTGPLQLRTRYTLACENATSRDSRELEVGVRAAPSAGWTRLKDMPVGLAKFGVAALGGKLYVTGGYNTLRTVLVYDVAADTWAAGPSLSSGTDNVSTVAAGGKVYVMGGEARRAVQIFDPAAQRWSAGPSLPTIRFASSAAELDGRIHLVGGWNYDNINSSSIASHDAFDLASQRYLPGNRAPLAQARNAAAHGVVDGKLLVVGGRAPGIRDADAQRLSSLEIYSPAADAWDSGPAMPTARSGAAGAALNGRLYVFGGELAYPRITDAVERYDAAKREWQSLPPMPYAAHGLGAAVVDGAVYVLGGYTAGGDAEGSESVRLYRYVPES